MSARLWAGRVRARLWAWVFCRVAASPGGLRRRVAGPLAAALVGAAVLLAWQAPGQQQDLQAAQGRVQALQAQLLAQRQQLAALPPVPAAASSGPPAGAEPAPWPGAQLVHDSGLQLRQWKRLHKEGATTAPHLQLQLQGRYAQHGAWMAALAQWPQPVRLISWQLQADASGQHLAEVLLEPVQAPAWPAATAGPRRAYAAPAHLDPLAEPAPQDLRASLPPPWRARAERPRQWLDAVPLSELALVGTLYRAPQWVALLRRDGLLHTAQVGDAVGMEFGRIERIDEHGLWLRDLVWTDGAWRERERHWRVGASP